MVSGPVAALTVAPSAAPVAAPIAAPTGTVNGAAGPPMRPIRAPVPAPPAAPTPVPAIKRPGWEVPHAANTSRAAKGTANFRVFISTSKVYGEPGFRQSLLQRLQELDPAQNRAA